MGTVRSIDRGYAALFRRLGKPAAEVTVGIQADTGAQLHPPAKGETVSGVTIAEVATYNEFGTSRIPRRSFVADWADETESENKATLRRLGTEVVEGKLQGPDAAVETFGKMSQGSMQRRMVSASFAPNAPSTIARKGSSLPLIDGGTLRKSIEYRVNRK